GLRAVPRSKTRFGAKWRSSDSERQYFKCCKVFYDSIEFLAANERVPSAHVLETKRQGMSLTLDAFQKNLSGKGGANE
ncbi:hypothetical protein L917_02263, partial [Phytophthora nicotianae]